MSTMVTKSKLAHPFESVKSTKFSPGENLSDTMIHHKVPSYPDKIIVGSCSKKSLNPYGVSSSRRLLSPGLFLKKYDLVRDCLSHPLGLTTAEQQVTLRLLLFWAYYGKVYPKEKQVTELPGCSKATFWRTIRLLKELGLIHVFNRYVLRPHAQISNLYRLDRLVLVIARYLAEHGHDFREKWLVPVLTMPGRLFWSQIYRTPEVRAGPGELAPAGS